jgi:predicted DNA-binding transcriptional regulator AlpA
MSVNAEGKEIEFTRLTIEEIELLFNINNSIALKALRICGFSGMGKKYLFNKTRFIQILEKLNISNPEQEDKILNTKESAKYLGVSFPTMQKIVRQNKLPFTKEMINNIENNMFKTSDLDIFISKRMNKTLT